MGDKEIGREGYPTQNLIGHLIFWRIIIYKIFALVQFFKKSNIFIENIKSSLPNQIKYFTKKTFLSIICLVMNELKIC